ncbi:DUF2156 domain-containing protein [Marispirochaeta aestuarii]|uniref:DUF2156 domain-containing protein n=1 Tax=Marispirochaeta aestuarii TaxID=1963862 RepID=UPI0029C749D6|nr:DUF2156 domain-containing protein [Marispirochaeta aestuarii]
MIIYIDAMQIPGYPEFAPVDLEMRDELHPRLPSIKFGISEFTFANLFLFRKTYNYRLSRLNDGGIVISGTKDGENFAMLPFGLPDDETLISLFAEHMYLKNLAEPYAVAGQIDLERKGFCVIEDRDNFDYLYLTKDLAHLPGKKYHKKRNLVKQFLNNYEYSEVRIDPENIQDAFSVARQWAEGKDDPGDTEAAIEALELKEVLDLCGYLYYVDGVPAAYVLGEPIARGKGFVVHFEKAIGNYKGIYQFINKAFASILPHSISFINREQDLGDPGLRQAKMTYRPTGFVKKFRVYIDPSCPCPQE